jgi:carbamoyltransferase
MGLIGRKGTESHDASAALFKDGKIIVAVEQERFSGKKHAIGEAPIDAALYCLKYAGVPIESINYIAYGWIEDEILRLGDEILSNNIIKSKLLSEELLPKFIFRYNNTPSIYFVKHHIAHMEAAFWDSGFKDAASLVMDGQGENESITLAEINRKDIKIIKQFGIPYSLGIFYDSATEYSGLGIDVPGKFMGLSAYGKPCDLIPIQFDDEKGEFVKHPLKKYSNLSAKDVYNKWIQYFEENYYPYKKGTREEIMYYLDFAATIQYTLNSVILSILRYLKSKTQSKNLIIAGGVGLNSITNHAISKSRIFKSIFIHPATNDAGCSIGAIYHLCRFLGIKIDKTNEFYPFLGPYYIKDECEKILRAYNLTGIQILKEDELIERVAEDLINNKIVAWFRGRTELGPRALGNRSILGNPRYRENLYKINKIKGREIWRPLAPSVLIEHFDEIFENDCSKILCRYMLTTAKIKKDWIKKIPAVVHVDETTRPQIVSEKHGIYYRLIKSFYNQTGIPLIINTSFNLANKPIVNTPEQAVKVFITREDIDVLVIENFYLKRRVEK